MDILAFEMEQRSGKMDTLKEQLREMEEEQKRTEQKHTEQTRQKELRIQKQITQLDTTIQDLEDMIDADLSLNVPIMCHTMPWREGAEMTLFEYHKEKFRKNVIWYKTQDDIKRYGIPQTPTYPINMIDGRGYSTVASSLPPNPLLDNPATNILAETSDKFVAILNIVKQQDARIEEFGRMFPVMSKRIIELERIVYIEEFERMFPVMSKRIIELERIVYDKDDSVVEERVNEEPPVEETNDELTSESDSDAEVESLRPVCSSAYREWIQQMLSDE